jgi:hypothetical protein
VSSQACDGEVFAAHKLVLMTRCPYFATMLSSAAFQESSTGVIKVSRAGVGHLGIWCIGCKLKTIKLGSSTRVINVSRLA